MAPIRKSKTFPNTKWKRKATKNVFQQHYLQEKEPTNKTIFYMRAIFECPLRTKKNKIDPEHLMKSSKHGARYFVCVSKMKVQKPDGSAEPSERVVDKILLRCKAESTFAEMCDM